MSALGAYGADMQVAQGIARIVLRAITSRPPHPIYGDDGVHELRSEEAVSALEWADQWLSRRIADNWSADGAHAELHKWNTR